MPIQISLPPYPTAEQVLQLTRTICLDAGISITGDLLADNAPGVVISAATQAGFIVTITTNQAHNFNIGQVVNVQNVGIAGYNGQQVVQTTPALNQFTYTLAVNGLGASSGGSVALAPSQGFILLNSAYQLFAANGIDIPGNSSLIHCVCPLRHARSASPMISFSLSTNLMFTP